MGLGPYPEIGLTGAREGAATARRQSKPARTRLPIDEPGRPNCRSSSNAQRRKPRPRRGPSVGLRKSTVRLNESGWRNPKHAAQWPSTLATYVYPVIGDRPIAAVTTDDVRDVLLPIWEPKRDDSRPGARPRPNDPGLDGGQTIRSYRESVARGTKSSDPRTGQAATTGAQETAGWSSRGYALEPGPRRS